MAERRGFWTIYRIKSRLGQGFPQIQTPDLVAAGLSGLFYSNPQKGEGVWVECAGKVRTGVGFQGELVMNAPSPVRSPGRPPSLMTE